MNGYNLKYYQQEVQKRLKHIRGKEYVTSPEELFKDMESIDMIYYPTDSDYWGFDCLLHSDDSIWGNHFLFSSQPRFSRMAVVCRKSDNTIQGLCPSEVCYRNNGRIDYCGEVFYPVMDKVKSYIVGNVHNL